MMNTGSFQRSGTIHYIFMELNVTASCLISEEENVVLREHERHNFTKQGGQGQEQRSRSVFKVQTVEIYWWELIKKKKIKQEAEEKTTAPVAQRSFEF